MQPTGSLSGWAGRLRSATGFMLPLAALVLIWAGVVQIFKVDPRVFPGVGAVLEAGREAVADGTLFAHMGASLGRIAVGTVIALALGIPLGIAMGVSPAVATFSRRWCGSSRCSPASPGSRSPHSGSATASARSPS